MSECTHNCDTCSANCASKENNIEKLKLGEGSKIKKIIGISYEVNSNNVDVLITITGRTPK